MKQQGNTFYPLFLLCATILISANLLHANPRPDSPTSKPPLFSQWNEKTGKFEKSHCFSRKRSFKHIKPSIPAASPTAAQLFFMQAAPRKLTQHKSLKA